MKFENYMILEFPSKSCNEAFARSAVACFAAQMDPTLEELGDIRTAVSEAVTNSIVHGYKEKIGNIYINMEISGREIKISVRDKGCGIEDIEQAVTPLYTSVTTGERSGMGFTIMETFMTRVRVRSKMGYGTCVTMYKHICGKN